MDDCILDSPWPVDLDPRDVAFLKRTRTILIRHGLFADSNQFNTLTASMVASWWNAGPVTIEDIRVTGNDALRLHHETADLRHRIDADLAALAREAWAPHIWSHDPRFVEFIPEGESTVFDIATSGSATDRRLLWNRLDDLRAAMNAQMALSLPEAMSEYVEGVSGQHGPRLDVLLAVTGLNGRDAISGGEAARRLNVSYQRIHQLVKQLRRGLERARPPQGLWLPQLAYAEETGWPDAFARSGIGATRSFFGSQQSTGGHRLNWRFPEPEVPNQTSNR